MDRHGDVTGLLNAWKDGDSSAGEAMLPLVYDELHRIAAQQRKRGRDLLTLQTTDLLHEAYLRLVDQTQAHWHNRAQFFAIASTMVRRVLLDYARRRHAQQRDRRLETSLEDVPEPLSMARAVELMDLDAALETLQGMDARQARIVEMRYFGGLTIAETADLLAISPATIKREWEHARAWLYCELHTERPAP